MTNTFPVTELRCSLCQRSYSPDTFRYTCEDCGNDGILEVLYDYEQAAKKLQPEQLQREHHECGVDDEVSVLYRNARSPEYY